MKLDHNSDKPLHIQAEEILRRLIESEEYKNGKLFPNEVELSEQLHISRNTLRQAINKLVFEGLLVRKKGYGTKVVKKGIVGGVKNFQGIVEIARGIGFFAGKRAAVRVDIQRNIGFRRSQCAFIIHQLLLIQMRI